MLLGKWFFFVSEMRVDACFFNQLILRDLYCAINWGVVLLSVRYGWNSKRFKGFVSTDFVNKIIYCILPFKQWIKIIFKLFSHRVNPKYFLHILSLLQITQVFKFLFLLSHYRNLFFNVVPGGYIILNALILVLL